MERKKRQRNNYKQEDGGWGTVLRAIESMEMLPSRVKVTSFVLGVFVCC